MTKEETIYNGEKTISSISSTGKTVELELSRFRRQLEEYLGCLLTGTLPTLLFFSDSVPQIQT